MIKQGWESAEFSCGTCSYAFTATTEQEYVEKYSAHLNAHALMAMLSPEALAQLRYLMSQDAVTT